MAETNRHNDFNRTDIERYRSGEMSYAEQYSFERRLQDEPAFADAYEGFLLIEKDEVDLTEVVGKLDRRLEDRIAEKKTRLIPLWFYSAAAGLLISIGAGWLVFFSEKVVTPESRNETRILKPETSNSSASPKSEEAFEEVELKGEGAVKTRGSSKAQEDELAALPEVSEPVITPIESESKSEVAESTQPQPLAAPDREVAKYQKSPKVGQFEAAPAVARAAKKSSRRSSEIQSPAVINGKVMDEAGQGIPGVAIQKSKNQLVFTDSVGNFSIDAVEGDSLNIAFIGYKNKNLLVGKEKLGAIVLEEDAKSLSEVVVVGYGTQQKRSLSGAVNVEAKEKKVKESPMPAQGWDAYNSYLEGKSKTSSQKGSVTVSFTVSADGSLSNFQAKGKKSLRDLAMQIIKEGPAWIPLKANGIGVERKAEVVVKFGGE